MDLLDKYFYIVRKPSYFKKSQYELLKYSADFDYEDAYIVDIRDDKLWCSCPGFLRQKYPADQHKHIRLIQDYKERGEPSCAQYEIQGKEHRIVYQGQNKLLLEALGDKE